MNTRYPGHIPVLALLVFAGGMVPSPAASQTVLGPEFTLSKLTLHAVQRDERQCEYFLWTKLGGDAQRVSFSYVLPDGKTDGDAPRIENVTIVIIPGKDVPTARITGTDDYRRTLWQLEMAPGAYDVNERCLSGIPISKGAGKP
ncbi:MAG: hypothetical protein ABR912_11445 [Terracidiphilus sp.]|jgi:hypothetical protein